MHLILDLASKMINHLMVVAWYSDFVILQFYLLTTQREKWHSILLD